MRHWDCVSILHLLRKIEPMNPRDFALDPAAYGLPTRDDLVKLRIWDMHYHGFMGGGIPQHEENLFYVERMGIERMLSLMLSLQSG